MEKTSWRDAVAAIRETLMRQKIVAFWNGLDDAQREKYTRQYKRDEYLAERFRNEAHMAYYLAKIKAGKKRGRS